MDFEMMLLSPITKTIQAGTRLMPTGSSSLPLPRNMLDPSLLHTSKQVVLSIGPDFQVDLPSLYGCGYRFLLGGRRANL